MQGKYCHLERLSMLHIDSLWENMKDAPHLWEHLLYGPYDIKDTFVAFIKELITAKSRTYYAVIKDSQPLGFICLMEDYPIYKTIEIGGIIFSPKMQRSAMSTEAIYLLLAYCFDELKYRRVAWRCDDKNELSKRAANRLGFSFEGVWRQHQISKGNNRDTSWFSIINSEWTNLDKRYKNWLDANNFDTDGLQKKRLLDC
jgi:RimJ/RimL family protein N-acetyltransferase